MKVLLEKYPLAEYSTRYQAMGEPEFIDAVMEKVRGSNYNEDISFEKQYLAFIEEVRTHHVKIRFIAETVSEYLFDHSKHMG